MKKSTPCILFCLFGFAAACRVGAADTAGAADAAGTAGAADAAGGAARAEPPRLLQEIFQDHAVLQRDRPIAVWGESRTGDEIRIYFAGKATAARADGAGRWHAQLPALHAGGPFVLEVHAASGASQSIADVLVGDVYLCSGQSNMQLPVARTLDAAREIAASKNDAIRLLTVAHAGAAKPLAHFQAAVAWVAAAPDSVRDFSAACYYFARALQKSVAVPLGLIHASWGGSRIEPWVSDAGLRSVGGFDALLDLLRLYARDPKSADEAQGARWEQWWRSLSPATPWKDADTDWREAPAPMRDWKTWGVPELAGHDGMVWFRRTVTLSAQQAAGAADLSLGAIDEVDQTWVNGRPVGNSFGYGTERTYHLPAGVLHAGENSIAVNVLSTWDAGGMYGPPDRMALRFAGGTVPLGGEWRYQFVPESYGYPPRAPWESVGGLTSLYNAMIAPIAPYSLRGVLWYQGESNAGEAGSYQALLSALMRDWRQRFAAELPFLIVELPNFGKPAAAPGAFDWASLREAQRRAVLGDAHAALAVTIDVGEPQVLHPPNKQAVGERLARAARHLIYGASPSASGPVPVAARRAGREVAVSFDGVEGALLTYSSRRAIGFELCGTEQSSCRFVDARVEANRVLLDGAENPNATRVRFCWADAPLCNLYDRSGLPAGPFEIPIGAEAP
ncbi:MAG TPA: sialate O-acetylesterase [Steroidobacteraceae bacterium]|jgi:sialate O-acetylesterase|nr:sialate O-acetylesterase [Steroidobacteraceae bacterium]